MPKYSFMISKAVDLVARKLAGMDPETVSRLTQVLSEEAQAISDELQHSGQSVNSDILAARLDGLVARMKYEVRNQGPDPSPNEFPIFNVSHNPSAPYPNPINHLYDKRYKEAYSTFIKQNPPPTTPAKNEPPPAPPAAPPAPTPTVKPNPSAVYPNYSQGTYPQQQSTVGWQYVNPYATMPRGQNTQYQRQPLTGMPPISEQSQGDNTQRLRHSSTADDLQPSSLSRSSSTNDISYSNDPNAEKIRVRVINNNTPSSSSIDTPTPNGSRNRNYSHRSILKTNMDANGNVEPVPTRRIYAKPNTEIGQETMRELFQVVQQQSPETGSGTTPMKERIIIIDRRGSNSLNDPQNPSGTDRIRTFEVRTGPPPVTPPTPPSPAPVVNPTVRTTTPTTYAVRPPTFYQAPFQFQQPNMYSSVPNLFAVGNPYHNHVGGFHPFTYYRY